MKLSTSASLLLAALASTVTSTLAAPSGQLVLQSSSAGAPSSRVPDFVDVLESEASRASGKLWPGPPGGGEPAPGGGWIWSTCGQDDDLITVEKIAVSPDPPVPGKNLTVTAKGIVKGAIEEGAWADVTVKIGLIKLLSRRFDICEEAQKNNVSVQCPVQPGEYEITQVVELPREIPPAKFNVHVNAFGAQEEDLTCLDLAIDFRKRS
ncbi:unnamed protein product [Sympodiomycopsis kandeliae]